MEPGVVEETQAPWLSWQVPEVPVVALHQPQPLTARHDAHDFCSLQFLTTGQDLAVVAKRPLLMQSVAKLLAMQRVPPKGPTHHPHLDSASTGRHRSNLNFNQA